MANVSLRDLLAAPVVTGIANQAASPDDYFLNFFGQQPTGSDGASNGNPNIEEVSGNEFSFDTFAATKQTAHLRAPGTGPTNRGLTKIGNVKGTFPRAHEKTTLLDEQIFRLRRMGQGPENVDRRGQQYVAKQTENFGQRFKNNRELLLASVLKGAVGVKVNGADWDLCAIDAGQFNIDFQVPSGNKSKLNMLGDGDILATSWDNAAANIIQDCVQINEAFKRLNGRSLAHVFINSATFTSTLLVNTGIKAASGTSNITWRSWERSRYANKAGQRDAGFEVVLAALPWITWHLYDGSLEIDGTVTKLIADNHAHFLPNPDTEWLSGMVGSEVVRENRMSTGDERFGMQVWTEAITQPSGYELIGVDKYMPKVSIPSCITDGLIIY